MSMIDVGDKPESYRTAISQALVFFNLNIMEQIKNGNSPKGNVFEAAILSGIFDVQSTDELIAY